MHSVYRLLISLLNEIFLEELKYEFTFLYMYVGNIFQSTTLCTYFDKRIRT